MSVSFLTIFAMTRTCARESFDRDFKTNPTFALTNSINPSVALITSPDGEDVDKREMEAVPISGIKAEQLNVNFSSEA